MIYNVDQTALSKQQLKCILCFEEWLSSFYIVNCIFTYRIMLRYLNVFIQTDDDFERSIL